MSASPTDLKLVVFDLDFTLWNSGGVWCDCLSPPFGSSKGRVYDAELREIRLYEDVEDILDELEDMDVRMGLASRTEQPAWAKRLLNLLGYGNRWDFEEIYPSSKVRHFKALREQSGFPYESMLFFDDEKRNIEEVGALGVKVIHVKNGLDWISFRAGLSHFS